MRRVGCWVLGVAILAAIPTVVGAQVVTPVDSSQLTFNTQHATPDSIRRPSTPMGAMFRSFLIPGWGQAVYGRKVTAGVMLGVEGLSWGMILKVQSETRYIQDTHSSLWHAKRQESQDWFTILVFNHLMSGLEAYVSSHLYDFPGDLQMRALPTGGMGVGVTLPIGGR